MPWQDSRLESQASCEVCSSEQFKHIQKRFRSFKKLTVVKKSAVRVLCLLKTRNSEIRGDSQRSFVPVRGLYIESILSTHESSKRFETQRIVRKISTELNKQTIVCHNRKKERAFSNSESARQTRTSSLEVFMGFALMSLSAMTHAVWLLYS